MPLTPEEVRRIAELARIGISDAEVRSVQAKLNEIFELIGQMRKVNTEGVEPMSHAQGAALRLRPDEVRENDQRSLFLKLAPAPDIETGLYLVPKVIE
jgi:aspartyl-tRNA(Asn)/glutamyl-tRNA(Gln) amidotransferase subunit C